MNEKLKYYPVLNGVRAVAAFMVILFHFFSQGPYPDFIKKISVIGQTGVTLFFVLSGFLITRILLIEKNSPNYFKVFYLGRTLRIFPLYYLFLAIFYIITPLLTKSEVSYQDIPKWTFFVFLQNVPMTFKLPFYGPDHFWSLAVEEHFYLVLPFVVFFLNEKRLIQFLYALIVLSILFRFLLLSYGFEVYQFTLTVMDGLAIGSLLALYEKNFGFSFINTKKLSLFLGVSIVIISFLWFALSSKALLLVQVLKFTVVAVVFCLLILFLIVTNDNNFFKRILMKKSMQFSGKISFGLYVFHPMCFGLTGKYFCFDSLIVDFITAITLTFIVSMLSFLFFESKFLQLKKSISF